MILDLEYVDSTIFTALEDKVLENLTELTSDNFSTVNNEPTDTELPMVYFKRITGIEIANDLEGVDLRGGLFTFEISVFSDVSQYEVDTIMNEVVRAMKSMAFWMTSFPVYADRKDYHMKTVRFQRRFFDGETLIGVKDPD